MSNLSVQEYMNRTLQAEQAMVPVNWRLVCIDVLVPTATALEARVQELEDKLKAAELVIEGGVYVDS
jgi:6-phosphogluconate dehydrogenase (decarboxylating)